MVYCYMVNHVYLTMASIYKKKLMIDINIYSCELSMLWQRKNFFIISGALLCSLTKQIKLFQIYKNVLVDILGKPETGKISFDPKINYIFSTILHYLYRKKLSENKIYNIPHGKLELYIFIIFLWLHFTKLLTVANREFLFLVISMSKTKVVVNIFLPLHCFTVFTFASKFFDDKCSSKNFLIWLLFLCYTTIQC